MNDIILAVERFITTVTVLSDQLLSLLVSLRELLENGQLTTT